MNLLIADTRKDVGRGHQSRISALQSALGGHIVEMDDTVPCGIRLDGDLICSGLEYALIRPEVVALRRTTIRPREDGPRIRYPEDVGPDWLERLASAGIYRGPCGVSALEACCIGILVCTWPTDDNNVAQFDALAALTTEERFQVIDGQGATRVKQKIREALGIPENIRSDI